MITEQFGIAHVVAERVHALVATQCIILKIEAPHPAADVGRLLFDRLFVPGRAFTLARPLVPASPPSLLSAVLGTWPQAPVAGGGIKNTL